MSNVPQSNYQDIPADELKALMDEMTASEAKFNDSLEEMVGEPISVYTDAEAVDDGFLVDLTVFSHLRFQGAPINRMTRHLFDDLEPFALSGAEALFDGNIGRALGSILFQKIRFASGSPDNTGEVGDIYRIPPNLWLVRNEMNGWTAMFPEDY